MVKVFNILNKKVDRTRFINTFASMACSRYEYVKGYETEDSILPNVWIVVRVDGKGFHKFSKIHDFEKPNDEKGMINMQHINKMFLM